ncbi:hypothetical protein [Streptococcus pyogenes]|uniref:hypothetical protein n=1 Tax=Streptococcus pyogenes TaxID=1314 RepID=UPI000DA28FCC|nr:hypothetical protein [Streptococcus pyogenes]SQF33212.1 hypothetical membrane associated protein [Streptococcus pyogenes]VGW24467.1 Uncharacterised protein [Streptococcus pyogenes]VGW28268.1 Uncharacterised protein [Streptococcus pyogenes]VGW29040.1 Uncharacterised protein [Streptococcus pyogenes]VGW36275.1 Uncharacterised protein [Streptococcus pyogenes]
MKTKSKRFLNLATLCLALLGTTLLTTQPVKAEGVVNGTNGTLRNNEERDSIKKQYAENWEQLKDPYHKGRLDGYVNGYEDGQKLDAPHPEDMKNDHLNKQPQAIPYDYKDRGNRGQYTSGYGDTYMAGYHDGWTNNNKIQATLEWLWDEISNWIFGLFTAK